MWFVGSIAVWIAGAVILGLVISFLCGRNGEPHEIPQPWLIIAWPLVVVICLLSLPFIGAHKLGTLFKWAEGEDG